MKKQKQLPPGIRIRNGKYHYRVIAAGSEWTGSTGYAATQRNLKLALRKLEEVRQKVDAGEVHLIKLVPKPFSDAVVLFNDWADGEYKEHPNSAKRLQTSLVSLSAFFLKKPIFTITAGDVENYKAWRRSCGIKEITLRHDLHALSKFMQYAMKHNWARRNVAREVNIPSDKDAIRQHVLSAKEEKAYFTAATQWPDLFDVARLILLQGLRPDEAMGLRQADVNLNDRILIIRKAVNRTLKSRAASRELRLVPESAAILARRLAKPHQFVFPGRWDRGHIKKLQGCHDRALKKAKVDFVLYDLRHTFATRMAEAGCPVPVLAEIIGHSNLRTIHRYVHPSRDAQFDAMDKYGASVFGPVTVRTDGDSRGRQGKSAKTQQPV